MCVCVCEGGGGSDLAKRGSTGWFQSLPPAEVQIVGVQDAARKTHPLTDTVVLFQPADEHQQTANH